MAGVNGLVLAFRADANKRIHKNTVLVKSTANTSTQSEMYAKIPAAANAAGILGVTVDHFVEPNFFIGQPSGAAGSGTNFPEDITGTAPSLYSLLGKHVALQVNGVARCISGVASIKQGDVVVVADIYGRVKPYTSSDFGSGQPYSAVGYAQHDVTGLDQVVQVLLDFFTGTA